MNGSLPTKIDRAATTSGPLFQLLKQHPRVGDVTLGSKALLEFQQGAWSRSIDLRPQGDPMGLLELIDNNPLVCADRISLPGSAGTLALIALGPLLQNGLLAKAPLIKLNFPAEGDLTRWLNDHEYSVSLDTQWLVGVRAAQITTTIKDAERKDLENLYEEHYSRSFYVRRDQNSDWEPGLAKQKPEAIYKLEFRSDSLIIDVLSDPNGKAGACQAVHAMNIMGGFEETLGIPTTLPVFR
jgi:N-acetyl-gamma-glutamylphosphate reductase